MKPEINVTVQGNANGDEVATATVKQLESWWSGITADAQVGINYGQYLH